MKLMPIYTGAEPLYKALAKASLMARENSEWSYVRERLDEVTALYEALLEYAARTGLKPPGEVVSLVMGVEAEDEPSSLVERLSHIESRLRSLLPYYKAASDYVAKARLAASLLLILLAGYLLYSGDTLNVIVTAVAGIGLGLSGILTYASPISPLLVFAGLLVQGLAVGRDPYLAVSWALAILIAAIACALPIAFRGASSGAEGA